jgi:hypothetical protein
MSERDARNINEDEMAKQNGQEPTEDNLNVDVDNASATNKENTGLLLGERRRGGEAISDEAAQADMGYGNDSPEIRRASDLTTYQPSPGSLSCGVLTSHAIGSSLCRTSMKLPIHV